MIWLYRTILILNLSYATLALMTGALPGWRMFSRMERVDFQLTDKDLKTVNIYEYLPKSTYVPDRQTLMDIVSFIERKNPDKAPLNLTFHE